MAIPSHYDDDEDDYDEVEASYLDLSKETLIKKLAKYVRSHEGEFKKLPELASE